MLILSQMLYQMFTMAPSNSSLDKWIVLSDAGDYTIDFAIVDQ